MNSKQAQACVQSAQDIIQLLKYGDFGRDSSKLRFVDMYTVSTRYYSHLNMVTLVETAVSSGL